MTTREPRTRRGIYAAIDAELASAYAKHGDLPWGRHEFYAILLEEVEETWDAIKGDEPLDRVAKEAVQVAAMVTRYLETGDRYQGPFGFEAGPPHPQQRRWRRCENSCVFGWRSGRKAKMMPVWKV